MFARDRLAGGEVVRYRMARRFLGQRLKVGSCYRVGRYLVDAGPRVQGPALRRALRGEAVEAILLTHGHEDHTGNAGFLKVPAYGAAGLRVARRVPAYRRLAWGEPEVGEVRAVGEGLDLGGVEARPFATPGHTADHVAYWFPQRGWLFAGDASMGLLRYGFRDEDIQVYLSSLRAMRGIQPAMVFPAHGPVLDRPAEQLGAQIAHLERLREEARRLAKEGLTPPEAARALLGREGLLTYLSAGEFSKALLVEGLLRERS